MNNKFIITGLPRSRTAWMSAYMCSNNVMCLHEPCNDFPSLEEMKLMVDRLPYEYAGISDSSIGIHPFFYIKNFKDCPVVFIKRDKEEVLNSFLKISGLRIDKAEKIINMIEHGIYEIKNAFNVFEVDYNDLDKEETMRRIFDYCTPTIPFDKYKLKLFKNIYVSQHAAKVLSGMEIQDNILNFLN